MELRKDYIRILEYLSQKGICEIPPVGISKTRYIAAIREMNGIYVRILYDEGGDFSGAIILDKGQAVLDNHIQEIRDRLERWLENHTGYDYTEIAVWSWLADNKEHFEEGPVGIDYDDFDAIITDMINEGYVTDPLTKDNGYKVSLKGRKQVEMWTQEEIPANFNAPNRKITKELTDWKRGEEIQKHPTTPTYEVTAEKWVVLHGNNISHNFNDNAALVKHINKLRYLYEEELRQVNINAKKNWKTPFLRKHVCGPKVKWLEDGHDITHEMVKDLYGEIAFSADQVTDAKK